MRTDVLIIGAIGALALCASAIAAPPAPAPQPIPAARSVATGWVDLPANAPTEVVPARASRRLVMLSSRPNAGSITIGDEGLVCGTLDGWIAFTADAPWIQIVEVPTSGALWACGNGVTTAVSFIEFFD